MTQDNFKAALNATELVVNGFTINKYKDSGLYKRFEEIFSMVDNYDVDEEQKMCLLKRGTILLASEVIHNICQASSYFRENPEERFLVFRTPGQENKEALIEKWTMLEKANWERQQEDAGENSGDVPNPFWN